MPQLIHSQKGKLLKIKHCAYKEFNKKHNKKKNFNNKNKQNKR